MRRLGLIMAAAGVCLMSGGCFSGGEDAKKEGPEVTVERFCRALAAGDWEQACCLCDTLSMKGYMEAYMETWESFRQKDSSALKIASSVLTDAAIQTNKVDKAEDGRIVVFTIEADDLKKERKAVVRKDDEGVWKITDITDAI